MILRFLLLFCLTMVGWGDECKIIPEEKPLIGCLQGILIVDNWSKVRRAPESFEGVRIEGICLLKKNRCSFLNEFLRQPLTKESIRRIKEAISSYYQSKDQLVVISVPQQELTACILQIVVEEAKLGEIRTIGNCYFPSNWLKGMIRTCPGEPIVTQRILEDIAWLNLNPFRRTDAIFTPGANPGTTDIELITADRWPYRVYMGADNTGTSFTNRNRLFFGFNFGKSVLKDGQISYQFTFAPNWNVFYAHTASARLPLPWRHILVLWGGYDQIEPHLEVSGFKNKGYSWQVDGRYRIPLFFNTHIMQELIIGYDFKETNNFLEFAGTKIFNGTADISQFMLGYELGIRNPKQKAVFVFEVYGSPGRMTHADTSRAYQEFRYGARSTYAYLKLAHSYACKLRYGWFTYDITGQASTTNLLPSEQFTMTGYHAVRGFEERILNLDNAGIVNVALETPHFSPMKSLGYCQMIDELYLLAFFDYGFGGNHKNFPGEHKFRDLASVGPGIRYQVDRYLTARLDYGFQLWHKGFDNPSNSRYNFGMILSY